MRRRDALIGAGALGLASVAATYIGLRQMGSMEDYTAGVSATHAALSARPEIRDLIRYATLAANGHNTQPWRFRVAEGQIVILPDLSRRTPVVDPDDHHMFASLGCAAENLSLAAGASGRTGEVRFSSTDDGSIEFGFAVGASAGSTLFDAIPHRQSTRADYDGRAVLLDDLKALIAASTVPGVDLVMITDRQQINGVRDLVVAGNSSQMADDTFVRELKSWLRFSPREALQRGDGLFSVTSGQPALPEWLGPHMFSMLVNAKGENEKHARQMDSSAGVAIFISERDDKDHWVRAGRACQRFALQATALGIKTAFMNQPVEVVSLRPELAALVGMKGRRPDIVMRFGYGDALPFSARRPVDAVLV
jgi:nitroreductase